MKLRIETSFTLVPAITRLQLSYSSPVLYLIKFVFKLSLYFCSAVETFSSEYNNNKDIILHYITVTPNHSNFQFIGNIHGPYKAYRLWSVKGGANEFDYQSV